jgi:uncharacterized membrane protein
MFLHIFLTILHSDTMNDEQSSRVFSKKEKKKSMRLYTIAQQCVYNMDINLCSGSSLVKIHTHIQI